MTSADLDRMVAKTLHVHGIMPKPKLVEDLVEVFKADSEGK